jgi:hypothetical protein
MFMHCDRASTCAHVAEGRAGSSTANLQRLLSVQPQNPRAAPKANVVNWTDYVHTFVDEPESDESASQSVFDLNGQADAETIHYHV